MEPRVSITLDCLDPEALAGFWVDALGYSSARRSRRAEFWLLFPADDREPLIVLQQVSEEKHGKNRMHLDVFADDLEAEIARLQSLGARRLTEGSVVEVDGFSWVVMADPEGNEFCLMQRPNHS